MSDFEFKLNEDGVRELLQSAEMQDIVSGYGNQVLGFAGDGYEIRTSVGSDRAGSTVYPGTAHAYYSNRKHKTLQKALGSVVTG